MKSFYLYRNNEQSGPFTIEELGAKGLIAADQVWTTGLNEWTSAASVAALQHLIDGSAPPPPPIPGSPPPVYTLPSTKPKKNKSASVYVAVLASVIIVVVLAAFLLHSNQQQAHLADQLGSVQQNLAAKNDEEQRSKEQAAAIETSKMFTRNNWKELIAITGRQSKIDETFGGISDITITITNNTSYPLDELEVLVSYIKENGTPFKTETVAYHNIAPHSTQTIAAPDSPRGTALEQRIISTRSTALNFCYSHTSNGNGNAADPWKCE
jgi:hypothetical protein